MDKQIIIDGVDVSGCECIIEDYQRANNFEGKYEHVKNVCELGERGAEYYNLFCKDNPNCYYKQLKRAEQRIVELNKTIKAKEQECEELKEEIKTNGFGCFNIEMSEQLDQLKSENEDINEKLKEKFSEFMLKSSFIIAFQDNLLNKYKQALKEIKEIAEEDCKQCFEIDGFSKPDDCGICPYNKILQKISEVIDD